LFTLISLTGRWGQSASVYIDLEVKLTEENIFQIWIFVTWVLLSDFHKYSENSGQLDKVFYHVEFMVFSISGSDIIFGITHLPLASTITLRHTTLGRTPLHNWSANSTELCPTAQNTHKRRASTPQRVSNPQSQQASGRIPTL